MDREREEEEMYSKYITTCAIHKFAQYAISRLAIWDGT